MNYALELALVPCSGGRKVKQAEGSFCFKVDFMLNFNLNFKLEL